MLRKNLVIIGASALGREVAEYAVDALPGVEVKGFLDSRTNVLDGFSGFPTIIGDAETYEIQPDDVFICALGEPEMRKKYVDMVSAHGGKFLSVIHPSAYVAPSVTIGVGCIVGPNASVSSNTRIGEHVYIGLNTAVCHDCHVGNFASISPGATVPGWCHIGERCFLGVNSALVPHIVLGDVSPVDVAAGAVVTKSFSSGRILGVPAKEFQHRFDTK